MAVAISNQRQPGRYYPGPVGQSTLGDGGGDEFVPNPHTTYPGGPTAPPVPFVPNPGYGYPYGGYPTGPIGTSASGPVPSPPGLGSNEAANQAYARAKDMIGNQSRAALMALRDQASAGGQFVAGGSNPALQAAEGQVISKSEGGLQNFLARQASQQAEAANALARMQYGAQLSEHGAAQQNQAALIRAILGQLGSHIGDPNFQVGGAMSRLQQILHGLGISLPGLYSGSGGSYPYQQNPAGGLY